MWLQYSLRIKIIKNEKYSIFFNIPDKLKKFFVYKFSSRSLIGPEFLGYLPKNGL